MVSAHNIAVDTTIAPKSNEAAMLFSLRYVYRDDVRKNRENAETMMKMIATPRRRLVIRNNALINVADIVPSVFIK